MNKTVNCSPDTLRSELPCSNGQGKEASKGWKYVPSKDVQSYANKGVPAIAIKPGHIVVIRPFDPSKDAKGDHGIVMAMSGYATFKYRDFGWAWKDLKNVKYYVNP